jgi:hypothetical protein
MKKLFFFSILVLATSILLTTTQGAAVTPTEVERVKDLYYFKIHGGPVTPDNFKGKAEFIYKNLSTDPQNIKVVIERKWGTIDDTVSREYNILEPGAEFSPFFVNEDLGVTITFWLYINNFEPEQHVFTDSIWIPGPNN